MCQRSHRNVTIDFAPSLKNASQGAVDRVSEIGKNALQTIETGFTDIWLIFSIAKAQNASGFRVSRVARRALRTFYHAWKNKKKVYKNEAKNTHFFNRSDFN